MPRRIPADVARVLADYAALGDAARRALHLSERVARREVETAARRAAALNARVRRGA